MIRLDKYLTMTTKLSRSEAKKMLSSGRVIVNGETIKKGDVKIAEDAEVFCDGEKCSYKHKLYFMLNKPNGYVSATRDIVHKTVLDLFPEEYAKRIVPVGRLDIDTEGLLLLTDDGDFNHKLTSPNHDIAKVYYTETKGVFTEEHIRIFEAGIEFEDFTAKPSKLEILEIDINANTSKARITVREGKFHQVKRMVKHVGGEVCYLKRERIGMLGLDKALKPGEFRELTEEEIKMCMMQ